MKKLLYLICVLYVLRMFVPIFMLIPSPIVLIFSFLLLLAYKQHLHISGIATLVIALFFFEVVMRLGMGSFFNNTYALLIQLPCILLAYYCFENEESVTLTRFLFFSIVVGLAITGYTTYQGCIMFPQISREMATGQLDPTVESATRYMNIGGFNTIYTLVLMMPIWVSIIKNKKCKNLVRMLALVVIVCSILGVVQSEYTTALLFTMLSLATIFLPRDLSFGQFLGYGLLAVIGLFLFRTLLPPVLEFIAENSDSSSVQERLFDLANIVAGKGADENSDAEGRFMMVMDAFVHWSDSPVWGHFRIWGGHSYLGNVLEYFGLIGLLLLVSMVKQMYKMFVVPLKNNGFDTALYTTCFIYVSFLVLNPQAYLVIPFIMVPICGKYLINISSNCY